MGCNHRWTHNGPLPNWGFIHCPKCGEVFPPTAVEDTPYQPEIEKFDDNELAKELSILKSCRSAVISLTSRK